MAVLTQPHNGRGKCMSRNLCHRGCPYGAYFSSNSSTLPAAYKTGNLTLRPFSIVHSIIWDRERHKATGVRVIDAETMETFEYFAPLIFLNASALATTKIMMQSTSATQFLPLHCLFLCIHCYLCCMYDLFSVRIYRLTYDPFANLLLSGSSDGSFRVGTITCTVDIICIYIIMLIV